MSDELPKEKRTAKTLDERFAKRPHTYRRLHEIADEMDQAIAKGATADEAEAMAIAVLLEFPIGPSLSALRIKRSKVPCSRYHSVFAHNLS